MKYCTHCGNQLLDEAVVCPKCGCAVPGAAVRHEEDIPSGGLNVISFLIPMVGLICFAVMFGTTPKKAKAAGKAALTGFVLALIFYIIAGVLAAAL